MTLSVDLTGRVALVTGGTQGIGAGIRDVLAAAGATVVTCARSTPDNLGAAVAHYACDVTDADAVRRVVEKIVADHGALDVLVNNAGGAPYALAADASARFHAKILGLNLSAPLLVAQEANAVMQQQGSGAIVNVSSISALRGSPGTAAYGAAKAGVDSLTRSLAMEWAPAVRVNAINVGLCRTEHTVDHYGGDATVAAIEATIPLGRMARPAEVGQVAAFLASDLASYVSGATIECHGGGEPPVFQHVLANLTQENK